MNLWLATGRVLLRWLSLRFIANNALIPFPIRYNLVLLEVCAMSSVLSVIIEWGASCAKVTAHARD